jgi:hypothetical protein
MTLLFDNISRRLKLAADPLLTERFVRRQNYRSRQMEDGGGRRVAVVDIAPARGVRSNGLLDE